MVQVTIPNGSTTSGTGVLGYFSCVGLFFGTLVGATNFSLTTSHDGTTFYPVIDPDTGTPKTFAIPAVGACYVPIDPIFTLGAGYLRIVMAEAVGADRTVTMKLYGV